MSINNLNSAFLAITCCYLQDHDVKALGITSKKIYDIAQKELIDRDNKLEQLLASYTIAHKFNIQTLKDVDLFCLGEIHYNQQLRSDQFALIDFLASRGPVIFILEGWLSMNAISVEDLEIDLAQTNPFNPRFRDSIYGIGWDDREDLIKLETAINQKYEEKQKQHEEQQEQLNEQRILLVNQTIELIPSWFSLIETICKIQLDAFQHLSPYEVFFLTFKRMISIVSNFNDEKINPSPEKLEEIRNLYTRIKLIHSILKSGKKTLELDRIRERCDAVTQTFPIRTMAMVNTLKKIDNFLLVQGLQHAKMVLIAGSTHLERASPQAEYDLTNLYEQLNNHKAAILLPSEILDARVKKVKAKIKELEAKREFLDKHTI
jgi:hypothetical protein